jgi:hypothetical protein
MITRTKCCQAKYKGEWRGLKLYLVCSYCKKTYKELGYLVLYEDDIVAEKKIKS